MKISRSFRLTPLLSAALAAASLTACAKLEIRAPAADAVVQLPSATHVELPDGKNLSNVSVTVDGADVSNQIAYSPTSGLYAGDLPLAAGLHTIVARADVFCAYCSGRKSPASDTKTFCVAGVLTARTSKTVFAQSDDRGWSSVTAHTVALAADAGIETKWTFFPKGGGQTSVPGTIQSRMFPCYCLHSPGATIDAPLDLAPCNTADPFQVFDVERKQSVNNVAFYQFTNEGFALCLAEGTGGQLLQSSCTITADRLWKVRHNDLNSFEAGSTPWGL